MSWFAGRRMTVVTWVVLASMLFTTGCWYRLAGIQVDGKMRLRQAAIPLLVAGATIAVVTHWLLLQSRLANSNAILTDPHYLYAGFAFTLLMGMPYLLGTRKARSDYSFSTVGVQLVGTALFYSLVIQPLAGGAGHQVSAATQDGIVAGTSRTIYSLDSRTNLIFTRFALSQVGALWYLQAWAWAWGATEPVLIHQWLIDDPASFVAQASAGVVGAAKKSILALMVVSMLYGNLPGSASARQVLLFSFGLALSHLLRAAYLLDMAESGYPTLVAASLASFLAVLSTLRSQVETYRAEKKPPSVKALKLLSKAERFALKAQKKLEAGAKPAKVWKLVRRARDAVARAEQVMLGE